MSETTFDLVEIIRNILKRMKFVVVFTAICVIAGAIFSFVTPKKYTAKSSFIVKGPMLMDRNHVFNREMYQNIVMFASEDDIDNVVAMSNTDTLLFYLVDKYKLQDVYGASRPEAMEKLRKDFDFKRNDTKNLEVKITAKTPELSADLTNSAVDKLNEFYGAYFGDSNNEVIAFIHKRLAILNDTISTIDDTITSIRATYGLYDKLLPSRSLKAGSLQNDTKTVTPAAAAALEKLQEITVLKDHLLEERAQYLTLINEYEMKSGEKGAINMLHVVQRAYVPPGASWPILWIVCGVCAVAGFFFACILVTISAFYRTRIRPSAGN